MRRTTTTNGRHARRLGCLAAALLAVGCVGGEPVRTPAPGTSVVDPGSRSPAAWLAAHLGREPVDYTRPEHWVCHPEFGGVCSEANLDAAVHLTDGTVVEVPFRPATAPAVDCFYLYPTVDLALAVGNHEELHDVGRVPEVVVAQAARWRAVCRLFAPLYRQVRLGTYLSLDAERLVYFERAFLDVAAAFETYLRRWNAGRPIVVLGHSQGAQMASYLLHVYFDDARPLGDLPVDTVALRRRLVAAYPIGFYVYVPYAGATKGGSFAELPICTATDATGCVVHYRSYVEGSAPRSAGAGAAIEGEMARRGYLHAPPGVGAKLVCVDPAQGRLAPGDRIEDGLGHTVEPAAGTRVAMGTLLRGVDASLDAPFVGYPGRYTVTCRERRGFGDYLAVGLRIPTGGDQREDPIELGGELARSALGLHLWDYALVLDDLVADLARRTATFLDARR